MTLGHKARRLIFASSRQVLVVGYFGSYARGNHGVGSDLDLVVLLSASELPPQRRMLGWPLETLPVPADVLVYTLAEWERLKRRETRFSRMLQEETVWLWPKGKKA